MFVCVLLFLFFNFWDFVEIYFFFCRRPGSRQRLLPPPRRRRHHPEGRESLHRGWLTCTVRTAGFRTHQGQHVRGRTQFCPSQGHILTHKRELMLIWVNKAAGDPLFSSQTFHFYFILFMCAL